MTEPSAKQTKVSCFFFTKKQDCSFLQKRTKKPLRVCRLAMRREGAR